AFLLGHALKLSGSKANLILEESKRLLLPLAADAGNDLVPQLRGVLCGFSMLLSADQRLGRVALGRRRPPCARRSARTAAVCSLRRLLPLELFKKLLVAHRRAALFRARL